MSSLIGNSATTRSQLESGLTELGQVVSADMLDKLLAYMALLAEWSRTYNLIASGSRKKLLARHILDSLAIAPWLQPGSLLDVGTGAGLPGIPLAIIKPGMEVTLLDGSGKKIRFIRHVERSLRLGNICPLQQRIESLEVGSIFANITARAFASLRGFVEAARPCTDTTTRMLAMKGLHPQQELEELPAWVHLHSVERLQIPGLHAERHIVIMDRVG